MIEITCFAKTGGALTKHIALAHDGSLVSDGSGCLMSAGKAWRTRFGSLSEFAHVISKLQSHEAIALGCLRRDLPDTVEVATKSRLEALNGSVAPNLIARTSDYIAYRPGQRAVALVDVDTKGMPPAVRNRVEAAGGFWPALVSVVPELATAGRVVRRSTSAGISRSDTGEALPGSNGLHVFPLVQDGADIERFLHTLHDRCWLAGFGWSMVGAGGQLLERSSVDRMVYAAERLVFEGDPVLVPPLTQDSGSRQATAYEGVALDTVTACPPLTIVEKARLTDLRAKEACRLAPDRAKARDQFVAEQAERIVSRTGCTLNAAWRTVERQCEGTLRPDVVLPFDDSDCEDCTCGDVLGDPERFVGLTLADPLEGIGYGRCKAKVMRRANGEIWINSFAHGRTCYELKPDAKDPLINNRIAHDFGI
jgi:hypothetical protein